MKQLDHIILSLKNESLTKSRLPAVLNEIRSTDSYSKLTLLARNSEAARKQMSDTINVWMKTSYDMFLNTEEEHYDYLDAAIAIMFVAIMDSSVGQPEHITLSREVMNLPSLYWAKMIAQSNLLKLEAANG